MMTCHFTELAVTITAAAHAAAAAGVNVVMETIIGVL